jgi:two-component system phosphate regulon response regulator PhoB
MPVPDYTARLRPVILLVDDYADALPAWEIFLQAEGFDVLTASTGPEALSTVSASSPDLVVLDLALPGLSGCDVARTLRSAVATQHIPLIAATGFSDAVQLEQARLAGFDTVLVKPCDPTELAARIRELLTGPAQPAPSA